jgi:hypothetical protein
MSSTATARSGDVVAELTTPEARALALEMAAGVCEADGIVNDRERAFLDALRGALNPGVAASRTDSAGSGAAPAGSAVRRRWSPSPPKPSTRWSSIIRF